MLAHEKIRKSKTVADILKLLALQIGKEVSLSEVGQNIGLDQKTVRRYLDILEQSFVIFSIGGYSGNMRNEVTSKRKYCFYDNGIRNALISDFSAFDTRIDKGMLWENFIVYERFKYLSYCGKHFNRYFWRTFDRQEIDYVEDGGGHLCGYEIKVKDRKVRTPAQWERSYPHASFDLIHADNYQDFVCPRDL